VAEERLFQRGTTLVGEQPYEEIAVFFLDHPDAVPQPGDENE